MELGIVTGYRKDKNKEGDIDRILLSVQIIDEDVRTIEFIPQHGEDTIPVNGSRVAVFTLIDSYQIAMNVSDDLESEVAQGEKEIYAVSGDEKKGRVKCGVDGNVVINQGTKSALNHPDTVTALNTFLIALNSQLTGHGLPGGLSIDLTAAESDTVKIPEKTI